MQRGARFLIFDVQLGGARWAESGRQKYYKTNDILSFLKKSNIALVLLMFLTPLWSPCWTVER